MPLLEVVSRRGIAARIGAWATNALCAIKERMGKKSQALVTFLSGLRALAQVERKEPDSRGNTPRAPGREA